MANYSSLLNLSPSQVSGGSATLTQPTVTPQQYQQNVQNSAKAIGQQLNPQQQNNPAPTQNTNTSGGGGGGQSRLQELQAIQSAGNLNPAQQTELQGLQQPNLDQQISDIYNPINDYLNTAEQNVRSDYPTVQSDIGKQYDVNSAQLTNQNTTNQNTIAQDQQTADYAHQSALAQARSLYNQILQGYQQRFGGSTSAGGAASEIANVEQQRQVGAQNQQYQQTSQQIANHKLDIDNQFQTAQQQLAVQRDSALNQANRDFQSKLLQISQSRAQNESAKAAAKLQALQDLRNQVFAINQQNTQFQQTLEAQRQQAALQLQNYQATSGAGLAQAGQSLSGYTSQPNITSNLGQVQQNGQNTATSPLAGAISSQRRTDQFGNPI